MAECRSPHHPQCSNVAGVILGRGSTDWMLSHNLKEIRWRGESHNRDKNIFVLWLNSNKDQPGLDLKALMLSAMLSLLPGLSRTRSLRAAVMSARLKDITCSTCLSRGFRWASSCSSVLPTFTWVPMRSKAVRRCPIYTSTSWVRMG